MELRSDNLFNSFVYSDMIVKMADMKTRILRVKNDCDVKVKRCCASCQHKCIDINAIRVCASMMLKVEQKFKCNRWQMSEGLNNAGKSGGKVKRKEYLLFVQEIRTKENDDIQNGILSAQECKTIEEIRQMFTEKFGSIYAIE